jgi:hypothetical protein
MRARKIGSEPTKEPPMTSDELHDVPAQRNKDTLLDRRLTVLETRFDTTLTMLPNKADLAEPWSSVSAA